MKEGGEIKSLSAAMVFPRQEKGRGGGVRPAFFQEEKGENFVSSR